MLAVTYDTYGSPDNLTWGEVDAPMPSVDQLLVKVRAAGLNPYDWHMYRGEPWLMRPQFGMLRPKARLAVGSDFAGEVVALGADVVGFAVGDEVFGGAGTGACAQYLAVDAAKVAAKPDSLTFEQAAALPMGAVTAYQGLRDAAHLQPGQRVLVNGASGGVGHLAVQIAKAMGASHVTAVCSGRNAQWVRGIGADDVIDYTTTDFTTLGERYDVIYDTVGGHGMRAIGRALTPTGIYAIAGGTGRGKLLGPASAMVSAMIAGKLQRRRVAMVSASSVGEDYATIAGWADAGKVVPVIDRTYPLADTADAARYLELGHVAGKLVITI